MESCYIPNNPQYELSLEYSAYNGGGFNSGFAPCDTGQDNGVICFTDNCETCGHHIDQDCAAGYSRDCEDFRPSACHQCTNCELNCDDSELVDINHCATDDIHINLGIEGCDRNAQINPGDKGDEEHRLSSAGEALHSAAGAAATSYWTGEDMAAFSLPSLDLDPLPSLFPFSPCANYKSIPDCKEKPLQGPGGENVADVLLSLKHAVVHAGDSCSSPHHHLHHLHHQQHDAQASQQLSVHPAQMVMGGMSSNGGHYGGGPPYYDQYGGTAQLFPTMSVNVSMNMTMHGYPPEQMQWNQNVSTPSVNVVYPQNQSILSPQTYAGGATYSFTADFRPPNQADPLITATSSFKPIQLQTGLFAQKPAGFASISSGQRHALSPMRTRASSRLQANEGPGLSAFAPSPYPSGESAASKAPAGALSGCSGSGSMSGDDEQKPNLCRICGKTYARPSTLKTHLRTHSGERPYRCADCNKSFSQAANLTAHVRTHTGQKPFRCPICDRRFSQSSSVTTHMRTHSGERPYRCRSCKKAFSDSSTLTKHLRIHSGEKPYQCKLCLLRFSQSGNLNRHMRVHGNSALLG